MTKFQLLGTDEAQYENGYKLGFVKDGKVNELNIHKHAAYIWCLFGYKIWRGLWGDPY